MLPPAYSAALPEISLNFFPAEQYLRYDVMLKLHAKNSPQVPEAFTADRLRTLKNGSYIMPPTLKQAIKQLLASHKDSLQYRLHGLFTEIL